MRRTLEGMLREIEWWVSKKRPYRLQRLSEIVRKIKELQKLPEVPRETKKEIFATLEYLIEELDPAEVWKYFSSNLQAFRKVLGDEEFILMLNTIGEKLILKKYYQTIFEFFEMLRKHPDLSKPEKFGERIENLKRRFVREIEEDIFLEYTQCWGKRFRTYLLEKKLKTLVRIVDLMLKYIRIEEQLGIKIDKNFLKECYRKLEEKEREIMRLLEDISSKILSIHEDTKELRSVLDIEELCYKFFNNIREEVLKEIKGYYELLSLWFQRTFNYMKAKREFETSEMFRRSVCALGILGINEKPDKILDEVFFPGHICGFLEDELSRRYARCINMAYVLEKIESMMYLYAQEKLEKYFKGNAKEPPKCKEILEFVSKAVCENIEFWFGEGYVKRKKIIENFLSKESRKEQ